jgi:hypothetical protein
VWCGTFAALGGGGGGGGAAHSGGDDDDDVDGVDRFGRLEPLCPWL